MIFINAQGFQGKVTKAYKYRIDWDGKSLSKIQKDVKDLLREYWEGDFVYEEFPVVDSRLSIDFFNASRKIAIEVDGRQHVQYNKHFHRGSRHNFLKQLQRDEKKETFCEDNGIVLYRVLEGECLIEQIENLNL